MKKIVVFTWCCMALAVFGQGSKITFDRAKDILILQYDSKPDPDDIHAQAAAGSMLAHPSLSDVNYYAVSAAYGKQGGTYMQSTALFNLAFGAGNWTNRDPNGDGTPEAAATAATAVKNVVKPILQAGGRVWVCEAGQSDVTADWIALLLADGISAETIKDDVLVIQHSDWNENETTPADLAYVKEKAFFVQINDGNANYNETNWGVRSDYKTPGYQTQTASFLPAAKSSSIAHVAALWTEADNVIATYYPGGYPHDWSAIHHGGVDFSDTCEIWFSLGLLGIHNTQAFWDTFVTAQGTVSIDSNAGVNLPEPSVPGVSTGKWLESGGILVMEAENADLPSQWIINDDVASDATMAGYLGSGWIEWAGPQTSYAHTIPESSAVGEIVFTFEISTPGTYNFRWRTKQHSDVHAGDAGNDTFVILNTGTDVAGSEHVDAYRKVWIQNKNAWSYAMNYDVDGVNLYTQPQRYYEAGTHTIKLAARSPGHSIDRLTLFKSDVAFNANAPESQREVVAVSYTYKAINDFTKSPAVDGRTSYYDHGVEDCVAIDAANSANRTKWARAELTFPEAAGTYDISIKALQENDGECTYRLLVNGTVVGTAQNSRINPPDDYIPQDHVFPSVAIPAGATLAVESMPHSNGLVLEGGVGPEHAWARGRWRSVTVSAGNDNSGIIVNAGEDQVHLLPVSSVNLTGSASDDGSVSSVLWSQVSGPNTAVITGSTQSNAVVSGLTAGAYVFSFTATDDESNMKSDQVEVNVVASLPVQVDDFSSYSGSINGDNWNPKWSGGTDQMNLHMANGGILSLDTTVAAENFHTVSKHGFALTEAGQYAVMTSDFRYQHMAGGNATEGLNKSAFALMLSAVDNWWTGPNQFFSICNRGTGIGTYDTSGADVIPHTSLGVDTAVGGMSDWFKVEWTIERGAANYTGTARILSDVGAVLYTGSPVDLGLANGGMVFSGYSTGGDGGNGFTTNVASYAKISQVDMDNFDLTLYGPNLAPVFNADPIDGGVILQGKVFAGSLASYVDDANGDALAFSKVSGPAWLTINPDGTYSGTPGSVNQNANQFVVKAEDPDGLFDTAAFTVTVQGFLIVYEDDFSNPAYASTIGGADWDPKNDGGTQANLMAATNGYGVMDMANMEHQYHAPVKHGFSLDEGDVAIIASDFRYKHKAGQITNNFNKAAFGLLISSSGNWSAGGATFTMCNRGGAMGNNLPFSPWVEGWKNHNSDFGVNPATGGYSDWFTVEWRVERGAANYVATARVRDLAGGLMYESTPIPLSYANGSTIYAGYSPGWSIEGSKLAAHTGLEEVNFDNFKIEISSTIKLGYEAFESGHNLVFGADGDDDGDGLKNLYEYAIGGNPTNAMVHGIQPSLIVNADGYARFSVAELTDPNRGVRYIVQASTNLADNVWEPLVENGSFTNAIDGVSGMQEIQYQFWTGAGAAESRYIRLVVEQE